MLSWCPVLAGLYRAVRPLSLARQAEPSATLGLPIFDGPPGGAIVGIAWLAAGQQPTLASAVVCAALGAISGFALAIALYRGGRLRRLRRRASRRAGGEPPALARRAA